LRIRIRIILGKPDPDHHQSEKLSPDPLKNLKKRTENSIWSLGWSLDPSDPDQHRSKKSERVPHHYISVELDQGHMHPLHRTSENAGGNRTRDLLHCRRALYAKSHSNGVFSCHSGSQLVLLQKVCSGSACEKTDPNQSERIHNPP
jgi:hypothetical protein